jgi:hypothetical protein
MKRLFLAFFCLALLAWPAGAQDEPTLTSLELALWPEFDQPEVLVIYRGLFAPETLLPVPVEIRIPARVGQPTAVAYVGEGGQRFNQEHEARLEGDWLVVSFELPTQGFQLEYYDALPVDAADRREYLFSYTADYDLDTLNLEFQVPPTAEEFTLEPPTDSVVPETDGLVYHLVEAGSLSQGETRSWTFSYQKADSDLTVSAFVQDATQEPPAPTVTTAADNSTVLIFLVAFVGLVAVGAAAFWLGRRAQPISEVPPAAPRRRKRRGSGRGTPPPREESAFCYKCGAELRLDSEFCYKCGAAVRKELGM